MGDMADWCIDQEIETAALHAAGQCEGGEWCPHCFEEEEKREKRRKARRKAKRRTPEAS